MPSTQILTTARELSPSALEGDAIQPGHPLFGMIWINRERMSGAPCFSGTRVPLKNLFDYLEGGYTVVGSPGTELEFAL